MKTCIVFVWACALSVLSTNALPSGYGFGRRPGHSSYLQGPNPHEAMMFSGFYGQGQPGFGNHGVMAAFANKDMVLTNSFAGEELPVYYHQNQEQPLGMTGESGSGPTQAEHASSFEEEIDAPQEEADATDATTRRPSKPKQSKKKPTTATPIDEHDNDDSDGDDVEVAAQVPFRGAQPGNVGNPSNTFFPILFGHGGAGATPGAAVAIANAFSTGKGGVASSHATAYGDPYFSRALGGGNRNKGNDGKNTNKQW